MAHTALDVYLNDHLGGATLGTDLAGQLLERSQGTPLGVVMAQVAPQIGEDRQTLADLMERLGTARNPVKQATAWVTGKATRAKFGGATSADPEFGLFMALETLTLGVAGKLTLWKSLRDVAGEHPPLAATDLDDLIARAEAQYDALENERSSAGRRVLGDGKESATPK
ncbi:MAG: hypothetical protein AVDCRST_MAG53-1144 [uncultured Solirubrobacteraceae bacterium]|uniref:Uncharacterized protein n=1 Tax=uncultured Solirubrobacteraceae bacterium TaxID=1162706 RepID=A0A6J4S332_9ACTN|nr:MAG: hypothetical protein AVDCRST_MAG53-1144 [uncultured Solirubrobacteraceae bacterium]